MYHRYLIRMNEPEDWLRHWDEGTQVVNDFIFPQGPYEKDEMSDTIYHKDATVGYHQHQKGYETFQIAKGSVECVIRGKRFVAHAGVLFTWFHTHPMVSAFWRKEPSGGSCFRKSICPRGSWTRIPSRRTTPISGKSRHLWICTGAVTNL